MSEVRVAQSCSSPFEIPSQNLLSPFLSVKRKFEARLPPETKSGSFNATATFMHQRHNQTQLR